ncbi:MAG TPA: LPXTG cell wall anchor domain-containing protein, partial [Actinomycetota bacterium]|nr:LPXTG cell wall anchor domain-containing protein [Actinomycetota bacterium]
TVQAGGDVDVSGVNWLQNSTVALTFQSDPVFLGTAQTDADGNFETTVQIPSDATAGQHTITATGRDQNGEPATADCDIVVTAGAGGGPGGVAFTGTNVSLGLIVLGVLIVAGLAFLVGGRRRKAHAE